MNLIQKPRPTTPTSEKEKKRQQTVQVGRVLAMVGALGIVLIGIAYFIVGPHKVLLYTTAPFVPLLITGLLMYGIAGRQRPDHPNHQ